MTTKPHSKQKRDNVTFQPTSDVRALLNCLGFGQSGAVVSEAVREASPTNKTDLVNQAIRKQWMPVMTRIWAREILSSVSGQAVQFNAEQLLLDSLRFYVEGPPLLQADAAFSKRRAEWIKVFTELSSASRSHDRETAAVAAALSGALAERRQER